MPEQPADTFIALLKYVKERENKVAGTQSLEPEFLKTLEFIKRHPELRPQVVEEFAGMLRDKSYGRYMLVQFCMHDLRWPEMRSTAKEIYAEAQTALIRLQLHGTASQHLAFLEEVMSSFDDNWKNRTLFRHYQGRVC